MQEPTTVQCIVRLGREIDNERKPSCCGHQLRSFHFPKTQVRFPDRVNKAFDLFVVEVEWSISPMHVNFSCLRRHKNDLVTYAVVEIEIYAMWADVGAPTLLSSDITMPRAEYSGAAISVRDIST